MGKITTIIMLGIIILWASHFIPVRASLGAPSPECQERLESVDGGTIDPSNVHFIQTGFPLRTFQGYDHDACKDGAVPFTQWFRFVVNGIFCIFIIFVILRNYDSILTQPPYPLVLTAIALILTVIGFINIFAVYN